MRYVVIMAGGSGKRLWPLSRQGAPKQLLPLFDGKSLLQLALERVLEVVPASQVLVCAGAAYGDVVAEQLPEILSENILGEPEGRDSLNAVAWSAAVLASRDPNAVVAVVTADQLIGPVDTFAKALDDGFRLATDDPKALVAFGVIPTSPHTGYGYLERGADIEGYGVASMVTEFKEKPDRETAEQYLLTGRYWWNAGMFVWQAQTLLDQLKILMPQTHQQMMELAANPQRLGEIYPQLIKISVDYGVMEPVSHQQTDAHIAAVGLEIDWTDVGSFEALHHVLDHDQWNNAVVGTAALTDSSGNLVINKQPGTVVGMVGVHDLFVVHTDIGIVVGSLAASQQVKELVEKVAVEISADLA